MSPHGRWNGTARHNKTNKRLRQLHQLTNVDENSSQKNVDEQYSLLFFIYIFLSLQHLTSCAFLGLECSMETANCLIRCTLSVSFGVRVLMDLRPEDNTRMRLRAETLHSTHCPQNKNFHTCFINEMDSIFSLLIQKRTLSFPKFRSSCDDFSQ